VAGRIVEAVERPGRQRVPGRVGKLRKINGRLTRNFDAKFPIDVDHVPGGNMSFRRDLLHELGGFDERFGGTAYLEETDVSVRVRRLGYRVCFQPAASLIHLRAPAGGCREEELGRRLYWYSHNYVLFTLKNLPAVFWPTVLAERLVKLAVTSTLQRCPSYFFLGLRGLWRGLATYRAGGAVVGHVRRTRLG
jgi:GT2 family glycosyltransferase